MNKEKSYDKTGISFILILYLNHVFLFPSFQYLSFIFVLLINHPHPYTQIILTSILQCFLTTNHSNFKDYLTDIPQNEQV